MPLVINGLGGRHTHANTHMHTDICTETILRTRHIPAIGQRAWFKNGKSVESLNKFLIGAGSHMFKSQ